MQNTLKLLISTLMLSAPLFAAPISGGACASGTWQEYIDLGPTGCTFANGVRVTNPYLTLAMSTDSAAFINLSLVQDTATDLSLAITSPQWITADYGATDWFILGWDVTATGVQADITITAHSTDQNFFVAINSGYAATTCGGPFGLVSCGTHDHQTGEFPNPWNMTNNIILQSGIGPDPAAIVTLDNITMNFSPIPATAAPEPATYALCGFGLLAAVVARKRLA